MCLSLKVEIVAGASIEEAAAAAQDLSSRVGVMVEFAFNGITCYATPHCNWSTIVEDYYKDIRRNAKR